VHRSFAAALTVGAVLWSAALVAAPAILAHGPTALVPAAATVYAAAGFICHQRPERSFHIAGIQLPVCARCFGLYLSAMAGAVVGMIAAGAVPGAMRGRMILGATALPTALTFALEVLGLAHPSNMARAIAAIPLGAAGGWIFVKLLAGPAEEAVPVEGSPH